MPEKFNTVNLFYRRSGSGFPLVILHGLFGLSDNWAGLAKQFALNFDTLVVDLRNHGQSPHSKDFNYQLMAADLAELLNKLAIEKAHVIGHSMGGKVAMQLAIDYPDLIEKLVVADIAPRYYPPHHQSILKALNSVDFEVAKTRKDAEQMMAKYINNPGVMQFLLKNIYWPTPEKMAWRFNLDSISNSIENIGIKQEFNHKIETETLFIRGDKSDYISDIDFIEIQHHFNTAQLKTIENAGHWLHAEKPEAFLTFVNEFLLHSTHH